MTAIELLPDPRDAERPERRATTGANYWGYSTLAFFAPDRRYASDKTAGRADARVQGDGRRLPRRRASRSSSTSSTTTPPRAAPRARTRRRAQLLVVRGLDNRRLLRARRGPRGRPSTTRAWAATSTRPADVVRNLVIDSLTYWHAAMGVDGFRFDLAPVLGNSCASGCFTFDADRSGRHPRSAPCDGAAGRRRSSPSPGASATAPTSSATSPRAGPSGTASSATRSAVAQNELGTIAIAPEHARRARHRLARRVQPRRARALGVDRLRRLPRRLHAARRVRVRRARRTTQAYPLGPSTGGSTTNDSWDQGGVAAAQQQAARTGLALVALSAGVPMFQGGDELLRTQYGNNNAYNLDDSAMWLDPTLATTNAALRRLDRRAACLPRRARRPSPRGVLRRHRPRRQRPARRRLPRHHGRGRERRVPGRLEQPLPGLAPRRARRRATSARSIYVAWNGWTRRSRRRPIPAAGSRQGLVGGWATARAGASRRPDRRRRSGRRR